MLAFNVLLGAAGVGEALAGEAGAELLAAVLGASEVGGVALDVGAVLLAVEVTGSAVSWSFEGIRSRQMPRAATIASTTRPMTSMRRCAGRRGVAMPPC